MLVSSVPVIVFSLVDVVCWYLPIEVIVASPAKVVVASSLITILTASSASLLVAPLVETTTTGVRPILLLVHPPSGPFLPTQVIPGT